MVRGHCPGGLPCCTWRKKTTCCWPLPSVADRKENFRTSEELCCLCHRPAESRAGAHAEHCRMPLTGQWRQRLCTVSCHELGASHRELQGGDLSKSAKLGIRIETCWAAFSLTKTQKLRRTWFFPEPWKQEVSRKFPGNFLVPLRPSFQI